jgi:hypothetical protein
VQLVCQNQGVFSYCVALRGGTTILSNGELLSRRRFGLAIRVSFSECKITIALIDQVAGGIGTSPI